MNATEEKSFFLLSNECEIAITCIYEGFNKLVLADPIYGKFYMQAFFNLSIGMERLLKLTLLMNFTYLNKQFPDKLFFKESGHNIYDLYQKCIEIAQDHNKRKIFEKLLYVNNSSTHISILNNISSFAENTRYFNLNEISNPTLKEMPFKRWQREIEYVLISRYNLNKKFNFEIGAKKDNMIERENLNKLNSTARKYTILYLVGIIRPILELLKSISDNTRHNIPNVCIPYFEEFYIDLLIITEPQILRKGKWVAFP